MPDITLEKGWNDIYAKSQIAVGTQISVQNKSGGDVTVQTSATEPTDLSGLLLRSYMQSTNKVGSSGEWAYSLSGGTAYVCIV